MATVYRATLLDGSHGNVVLLDDHKQELAYWQQYAKRLEERVHKLLQLEILVLSSQALEDLRPSQQQQVLRDVDAEMAKLRGK